MLKLTLSLLLFCATSPCFSQGERIAFLADIHLHDIFGKFEDQAFQGVPHPIDQKPVLVRSMASQLRSTRIFNENYFALIAALNDIAQKGIKIVALPGDYTDDGQAYNLRGLKKLLKSYTDKYGIRFFITTGNHDPLGPFRQEGGKADFLDHTGKTYGIFSSGTKGIITADIAPSGYQEILLELDEFGFMPHEKDYFWASPFSTYSPKTYSYSEANHQAAFSYRQYEISPGFWVPDFSYVVEPIPGVWLLAIDGNTYIPRQVDGNPKDSKTYKTAGIGYNEVLTHKTHLVTWIKEIGDLALKGNKKLIAFSHYPAVDYNDHAGIEISELLGPTKWQLHRAPSEEVAEALAAAGIKIHFGGHMHINDTGIRKYNAKDFLFNIQVPSLAAYIPAYKELKIHPKQNFEIITHRIENVPDYNYLFPLYEKEHAYLKSKGTKDIWRDDILKQQTYLDFTRYHLEELVRLRYVPSDWPQPYIATVGKWTGQEWFNALNVNRKAGTWTTSDLLSDIYKFQSADELAKADIPKARLKDYQILQKKARKSAIDQHRLIFALLEKLGADSPADHFVLNLNKGTIKKLK